MRALILADTRAQADSEEGRQGRLETAALAEREGAASVVERLLPKLLGDTTLEGNPKVVAQVRAMMLAASAGEPGPCDAGDGGAAGFAGVAVADSVPHAGAGGGGG